MLPKLRGTTALEAELKARVDRMSRDARRPLDDLELRDAERLVRLLDLNARVNRPPAWLRLAFLAGLVAGVTAPALIRQPRTAVRITVEANAGQLVMGTDEPIVLGASGEEITLSGFRVRRAPAELGT